MIPGLDIHRAAWLMMRRHGVGAAVQAALRGDQLLARGDRDGMLAWVAITPAIERLQVERSAPAAGSWVRRTDQRKSIQSAAL